MKRSLTFRTLLVYLPIDIFFSIALCFAHLGLFDVERQGPYIGMFAALWPVRFFGWFWIAAKQFAPAAELEDVGARVSDAELERAGAALNRARAQLAPLYSSGWFLHLVAATLYMGWFYPEPQLVSPFSLEASVLLVLAVLFGALVFSIPLIFVLSNPEASAISLAARSRGLKPLVGRGSLQQRISSLALGLGLAPTLFVASLGYSNAGLAGLEIVERDAEKAALTIVAEAARLSTLGEEAIGEALEKRLDDGGGLVVDRAGRVIHGSRALDLLERSPSLTKSMREAIRLGEDGVRTDRTAGVAMALASIDEDRVAVSIVTSSRDRTISFLIAAIAFVLTVLVWAPLSAVLFSRSIAVPIAQVTESVRKLVEEGRFSELGAVPVVTDDDVGRLGVHFNELLDLLRSLSDVSREVAAGRLDVTVRGEGDLPEAFRNMTESLRGVVAEMSETALQLGSAATEIFAATQEQEMAATTQSSSMREISQTMESLSESAAHVADAVEGVLDNAERTVDTTERMVARIGELNAHAGRIGELLEVIREIADRSDLLALNGALEASHAGEAGRGFALVASEMRRLAERVTASVQDVRALVEDIRQSGSSTVMATEESKKLAMLTTEAARKITLVTQQQRSSTEQVSESVRELTDVVSQSVAATSQTRASSETLKERADLLGEIVRRFRLDSGAAG